MTGAHTRRVGIIGGGVSGFTAAHVISGSAGLWRYTRHPNYFGDACVWWGIWLVAASAWRGVLTVPSPIAMTYFLVFATGAKLLEKTMMERPGYPEYAARTSMFVPLPPKS